MILKNIITILNYEYTHRPSRKIIYKNVLIQDFIISRRISFNQIRYKKIKSRNRSQGRPEGSLFNSCYT